jgi:hypothetical protein
MSAHSSSKKGSTGKLVCGAVDTYCIARDHGSPRKAGNRLKLQQKPHEFSAVKVRYECTLRGHMEEAFATGVDAHIVPGTAKR